MTSGPRTFGREKSMVDQKDAMSLFIVSIERNGPNVTPQHDLKDGLTAYGRLADALWTRIASGEWQPGNRLPTVVQLAEEYDVAGVTVRAALRLLSEQGLIHARQGRGTFVAMEALDQIEPGQGHGGLEPHYFES